jgi:hypothetical protein
VRWRAVERGGGRELAPFEPCATSRLRVEAAEGRSVAGLGFAGARSRRAWFTAKFVGLMSAGLQDTLCL